MVTTSTFYLWQLQFLHFLLIFNRYCDAVADAAVATHEVTIAVAAFEVLIPTN